MYDLYIVNDLYIDVSLFISELEIIHQSMYESYILKFGIIHFEIRNHTWCINHTKKCMIHT